MAVAGPQRTERFSVLFEPNSGVEDPTRAGGRGQGRRRGREESEESSEARPGATARALLAVHQGSGGERGAGTASLAFLVSPHGSRLGWLSRTWSSCSEDGCAGRGLSGF
ncbi:hypothetical protein GW7_16881 [Heterocephalus glaber]|uniref:Uncharacterized protein n=1 Tax=Heterocephalus glaber TaxID=10181 RepID=G5BI76_HETGA|nr:hypothetical protein GW7_16881 [Heterocephalus glaber]